MGKPDTKTRSAEEILDDWMKIYHEINYLEEELGDRFDKLHEETCHYLVNKKKYEFADLFWTQERLDRAEKKAKKMAKILGWGKNND